MLIFMRKKTKQKPLYREVLEIALAFAVAWLFYQGLAFALGTPLPVVSVVSGSMFHGAGFDEWWGSNDAYYIRNNISRETFLSFPFGNGLAQGDLLVIMKPDKVDIGDVVIYQRGDARYTIIHRIVGINGGGYVIKGDNNERPDPGVVKKSDILGKAVLVTPLLGYPRIALFALGV